MEKLLATGAEIAPLARRFNLSPDSLRRHWKSHVTKERIAELQGKTIFGRDSISPEMLAQLRDEEADRLILRLVWARAEAMALVKGDQPGKVKASALGVLVRIAETEGRLLGQIKSGGTTVTNQTMIVQGSDMAELRSLIDDALRPFPEARTALLAALARSATPRLESNIGH